jgi:hypothetical protein
VLPFQLLEFLKNVALIPSDRPEVVPLLDVFDTIEIVSDYRSSVHGHSVIALESAKYNPSAVGSKTSPRERLSINFDAICTIRVLRNKSPSRRT